MPAPKGVPHRKPTKQEQQKIQSLVIMLLSTGRKQGEIKTAIADKFGLRPRSVERYLRRAREIMLEETGKAAEEHRTDAYHFYLSIVNDSAAPLRERIKARERIDKLLGLDKPTVWRGESVNLDLTPEDIAGMSDDELATLKSRLLNNP